MRIVKLTAALAAATLGALALYSCAFSAEAEAGPGVPVFGGTKVKVEADGRRVTPQPDENGGFPRPGDCVRLHFKDGAGNEIGTADVPAGKTVEAPEGTEGVTWSPCDPPADDGGQPKTKQSGGSSSRLQAAGTVEVPYRSFPLSLEHGRGRWCDYVVDASSRLAADAIADEFERDQRLEEPKAAGLEAYTFAEVRVRPSGDVRFSAISWDAPKKFEVTWNGTRLPFKGTSVKRSRGGWYATTVVVPAALVDYGSLLGGDSTNQVEYSLETAGGRVAASLTLDVRP